MLVTLRIRGPRAQTIDLSILAAVAATSPQGLVGENVLHCCMPPLAYGVLCIGTELLL